MSKFHAIDLDAFGVPHQQLKILFDRGYRGHVYVTCVPGIGGLFRLPDALLEEIGFTQAMIRKCPMLFGKSPRDYFLAFLARRGVKKVHIISLGRKHYLHFAL